MSFLKPDSTKDLFFHLLVVVGIIAVITLSVFYLWLPSTTNHGETITVPNIQGMTVDELDDFLGKRDLRFEVTADSSYSPDAKPFAVLNQVPAPNAKVKENRKIYVTLNTERPPMVKFPNLIDKSLKAAQMVLASYDLALGEISYVPDPIAFGTVHEVKMDGRLVLEGEKIVKGSVIDLVVGDGYGNTVFQSPLLLGLDLEEAQAVILGSGLKVGKVNFVEKSQAGFVENDSTIYREVTPGSVQNQFPSPGIVLKIGDLVDMWIYRPDTITEHNAPNLLDN